MSVPERIWFVDTNMNNFVTAKREPGNDSPFEHWLQAKRLFVTPATEFEYHNNLHLTRADEPVFAYEAGVGLVALGWVRDPKDLVESFGGTVLHPKAGLRIRSIGVDWDPSVRRLVVEMTDASFGFAGPALRKYDPGTAAKKASNSRLYLERILAETEQRRATDSEAVEAAVLKQIRSGTSYPPATTAQIVQARLGQGTFRNSVLAREPACRVTGISHSRYLVASHIKPWAVCADGEHLDDAMA